jgi:putative endonuclease
MLASGRNGTLCIGVTNDLSPPRLGAKNGVAEAFAKKHCIHLLAWFETHVAINDAVAPAKQLRGWNRAWKIRLIEQHNSGWNDLAEKLNDQTTPVIGPGSPRGATLARPGMTTPTAENP